MSLPALREALRAHGGTVAELVVDDGGGAGTIGPLTRRRWPPAVRAWRGQRRRVRAAAGDDLRGLAAALRRSARGRVEDPDLALLLGDQLYALGLSRLAELGDLEAVAELADVISLLAQARASRRRERWPTRSGRPARRRSAGVRPPRTPPPRPGRGPVTAMRPPPCVIAPAGRPRIPSSGGACDARLFVDCTLSAAFNAAYPPLRFRGRRGRQA